MIPLMISESPQPFLCSTTNSLLEVARFESCVALCHQLMSVAGGSIAGSSTVRGSSRTVDGGLSRMMALESASIRKAKQLEIEDAWKNEPEMIDRCYTLLFGQRTSHDDILDNTIPFSEHYRYLSKVPKLFLCRWIPSISRLGEAQIREVSRQSDENLAKALCCALCQELLDPIGPLDKQAWMAAAAERHVLLDLPFDRMNIVAGRFDFSQSGIFRLVPPCLSVGPEEQEAHTFTGIEFMNGKVSVDFDAGFRCNGLTKFEDNWSHRQCMLVRTGFVPERVAASEFLKHDETFTELIKPMFQSVPKAKVVRCN